MGISNSFSYNLQGCRNLKFLYDMHFLVYFVDLLFYGDFLLKALSITRPLQIIFPIASHVSFYDSF